MVSKKLRQSFKNHTFLKKTSCTFCSYAFAQKKVFTKVIEGLNLKIKDINQLYKIVDKGKVV